MFKSRRTWLLLATLLFAVVCLWTAVRVRSSSWYIAETKYAQIKEGMVFEEVEAIMGESEAAFGSAGQFSFVWRFGDFEDGYSVVVTFDAFCGNSVAPRGQWPLVSKSIHRPDSLWERLRAWLAF